MQHTQVLHSPHPRAAAALVRAWPIRAKPKAHKCVARSMQINHVVGSTAAPNARLRAPTRAATLSAVPNDRGSQVYCSALRNAVDAQQSRCNQPRSLLLCLVRSKPTCTRQLALLALHTPLLALPTPSPPSPRRQTERTCRDNPGPPGSVCARPTCGRRRSSRWTAAAGSTTPAGTACA